MKKKWSVVLASLALVLSFFGWQENIKGEKVADILDSISEIDTIVLKDGKTLEKVLTLSKSDPTFSEMIDIYSFSHDLTWSQRRLIKDKPLAEIEYLMHGEVKFIVSIYRVEDKYISNLPDNFSTEVRDVNYSYSPKGSKDTYIFALKEINQLIDVGTGIEEFLNKMILK